MSSCVELNDPETSRLHNIIDMGLEFSAMIRLFRRGSKEMLREKILDESRHVFNAKSQEDFDKIHADFCDWGVKTICLAKTSENASYGQIAKTFNVVLNVAVYYCHLPNYKRSRNISRWLHAAVDTKMMAMLKKCYRKDFQQWPTTIKKVDESTYMKIREIVGKFISKKHNGKIMPVQFDDIYWEALNR